MTSGPPRTPLLFPGRYFERTDDPLPSGLAVFAVYLVGTTAYTYLVFQHVLDSFLSRPVGLERAIGSYLPTTLFFAAVSSCVALLVVAAVLHFGSGRIEARRGEFRDAVAVAGWGYAPNVLVLPVAYLYVREQLEGLTLRASDLDSVSAEVEAVQSATGEVHLLLTLVVVAWSVYVLGYGIAATHDVDTVDAFVLAGFVGLFAFLASFI